MACKVTCTRCGDKFDRFSGKLINISDEGLREFYNLTFIKEVLNSKKHPVLCAVCLKELLGRNIRISDIKFKNNRWMTSNVAYLIASRDIPQFEKDKLFNKLKELDNKGVLPFKNNTEGFKEIKNIFLS